MNQSHVPGQEASPRHDASTRHDASADRDALARLEALPRLDLAHLPTPLLPAPNLEAALGGNTPSIRMKMDDWTGLALGGNKVRKLEFFLGGRPPGTDTLITCGGPQSNHCRVTAAVAAQLGMRCVLVVNGEAPDPPTANSLLMRIFGAEIMEVAKREDRAPAMEEIAARSTADGGKPLIIPLGASTPLGALGYVRAAVELDQQMTAGGGWPGGTTWIFLSSSSCGTLAGLALGFTLLGRTNVRLVGVSADVSAAEIRDTTAEIARGAAKLLGEAGSPTAEPARAEGAEASLPSEPLSPEGDEAEAPYSAHLVTPEAGFVGAGYGIPTEASDEATRVFGSKAGVILDPVYTAKAGAGFLHWIREGRIPPTDTAIFWHTGGAPALFA